MRPGVSLTSPLGSKFRLPSSGRGEERGKGSAARICISNMSPCDAAAAVMSGTVFWELLFLEKAYWMTFWERADETLSEKMLLVRFYEVTES